LNTKSRPIREKIKAEDVTTVLGAKVKVSANGVVEVITKGCPKRKKSKKE